MKFEQFELFDNDNTTIPYIVSLQYGRTAAMFPRSIQLFTAWSMEMMIIMSDVIQQLQWTLQLQGVAAFPFINNVVSSAAFLLGHVDSG